VVLPDAPREARGRRPSSPPPDGWFDRFGGKLVLVLLDNKFRPSLSDGRSLWALHDPLVYRTGETLESITVPRGFPTDLASIPRIGWFILPVDGPWVKAAIIHDFLYTTAGTGRWGRWETRPPALGRGVPYTRREADRIMLEAMENRGVGWLSRTIIYLALRIGGSKAWERRHREREAAEAEAEAAVRNVDEAVLERSDAVGERFQT
jgi:hypothetical protein